MGAEESVSVLRKGDICLDERGSIVKVWGNEFPFEHEGLVWVVFLNSTHTRGWYCPSETLTRIDPAFYKLYGIGECDDESTTR